MTYIPHGPLWCWVLQGEDALFFSQPTIAYLSEGPLLDEDGEFLAVGAHETRWLDALGVCAARCQHQEQFVLDHAQPYDMETGAGLTPPIQCGHVARPAPDGQYLCDYHVWKLWHCQQCYAFLPNGGVAFSAHTEGGFCSHACRTAYNAGFAEEDP